MSGPEATTTKDSPAPLEKQENIKTLSSFVTSKCETKEVIEWNDLIEWFVCGVIGIDSKTLSREDLVDFDWDDVLIDGFGTARISILPSNAGSSPPQSPQSFSEDISSLSLLFVALIEQLSTSNCLPPRVEQHFLSNLLPSVLLHLISHLIGTGSLVPRCGRSKIEELVHEVINYNWVILNELLLAYYFCVRQEICHTIPTVSIYNFFQHTEDFCFR
ncbi:hypothetical protein BLNAU_16465 [Blattamonas nauphoetae]|uniref:Uncharacterized protein n=1 Tax=Blattamonas nauphoetae TaxID=2049346 RepID=A0ABQ9XE32_9EUKA|nr:hypothetical protein BLNAU_16465 [Blattamonas nauphoetae]